MSIRRIRFVLFVLPLYQFVFVSPTHANTGWVTAQVFSQAVNLANARNGASNRMNSARHIEGAVDCKVLTLGSDIGAYASKKRNSGPSGGKCEFKLFQGGTTSAVMKDACKVLAWEYRSMEKKNIAWVKKPKPNTRQKLHHFRIWINPFAIKNTDKNKGVKIRKVKLKTPQPVMNYKQLSTMCFK